MGAMKKTHGLFELFGADAAIIFRKDGVTCRYESRGGMLEELSSQSVLSTNTFTPEDFRTVREQMNRDAESHPTSEIFGSLEGGFEQPVRRPVRGTTELSGGAKIARTYFNLPKN